LTDAIAFVASVMLMNLITQNPPTGENTNFKQTNIDNDAVLNEGEAFQLASTIIARQVDLQNRRRHREDHQRFDCNTIVRRFERNTSTTWPNGAKSCRISSSVAANDTLRMICK
jgi:hypothetical protein